ncbi:hypothetical protein D3C85_1426200 [compost metagenome]
MTGVGYVSYAVIQTTVQYIMEITHLVNEGDYQKMTWGRAAIQVISVSIALLVSKLISDLRRGFNFVPVDASVPVKYKPLNVIFMSAAIVSSVLVATTIYFIEEGAVVGLFGAVVIFAIALYILIYLSIRKEYEDHD